MHIYEEGGKKGSGKCSSPGNVSSWSSLNCPLLPSPLLISRIGEVCCCTLNYIVIWLCSTKSWSSMRFILSLMIPTIKKHNEEYMECNQVFFFMVCYSIGFFFHLGTNKAFIGHNLMLCSIEPEFSLVLVKAIQMCVNIM